jgi:hypothetical protein
MLVKKTLANCHHPNRGSPQQLNVYMKGTARQPRAQEMGCPGLEPGTNEDPAEGVSEEQGTKAHGTPQATSCLWSQRQELMREWA